MRRDLVTESLRQATSRAALAARLDALEQRGTGTPVDPGARRAVQDIAADLVLLRDSLRLELMAVDSELQRLTEIIDEVAGGMDGPDPSGPLTPEEEPRWVVLSADPEPGVRFSALVRLGRARTERSVQASLARLRDPAAEVVWQAACNLGAFRERGAAPQIARLLSHPAAVVRAAAYAALLRLGAPPDTGYAAVAPEADRATAAERLRAWAEE